MFTIHQLGQQFFTFTGKALVLFDEELDRLFESIKIISIDSR